MEIKSFLHPRTIRQTRIEGKVLEPQVRHSVQIFFFTYAILLAGSILLFSLGGYDFETNFSMAVSALSNMGPGFGAAGPMCNYSGFPVLTKSVMIFDMLAGRLELFPMLLLFAPGTWKK